MVAVTEYVPEAAVVTPAIVGFWEVDVKLFGPVQENVLPAELAVKLNVFPEQTGVLLPAVGPDGIVYTVAVTAERDDVHPLLVAST